MAGACAPGFGRLADLALERVEQRRLIRGQLEIDPQ